MEGSHVPPPYQQQQQQPSVVIHNHVAASAAAAASASAGGWRYPRRRQSGMVHLVLFLLTAGLGNLVYAWYISRWNRRHGW